MRHFAALCTACLLAGCGSDQPWQSQPKASANATAPASNEPPEQFLLAASAKDFHDHQPPTPASFREVRFGHIVQPDGTKMYLLSGQFQPTGVRGDWTPFATIKTSGYEQLLGAQAKSYCEQPSIVWEDKGDLSASLKSRLDEGASIEAVTNGRAARTPLMQAAVAGHLDLVRFLLERGADPNHLDVDYFGPLTFVADKAHWDVVRLLIERGANPGMGDGYGKTALDYAKAKGPPEMVRYLEAKQKAISGR